MSTKAAFHNGKPRRLPVPAMAGPLDIFGAAGAVSDMMNRTRALLASISTLLTLAVAFPLAAQTDDGFVSLFDGTTLDGWKVGDNASVFSVQDGMIVMQCTNGRSSHLFYDGPVRDHSFKNFDLRVDVMTYPGCNSGIYFHTRFQNSGFPRLGIECQVDNSHSDWRRTGSLYGIKELTWGPQTPPPDNKEDTTVFEIPPVQDNAWYTQEIICENGKVTVKLAGKKMFTYQVEDADQEHKLISGMTWLPQGTIALQGHPPMRDHISKACFKNIQIKILPD
jgi:hypothetical protein